MGWIAKLVTLGAVGYCGYAAYDLQKGGYFDLPEMPAGAYNASFKNGLRGILLNADVPEKSIADRPAIFRRIFDADPERKYLGIPMTVAPWFEDVWSTCVAPTDEMRDKQDFRRSSRHRLERSADNECEAGTRGHRDCR